MLDYVVKNPYTVYSIWKEISGTSGESNFTLSVNIDETLYNIITPAWFGNALKRKYYDRLYYSEKATAAEAATEFINDFAAWSAQTGANYGRMMLALVKEYNPIENYNSFEEIETEHGKVQTTEYGKIDTWINEPDGASVTTTNDVYGYNSASAVPSGVSTSTKSGKDTNTDTLSGSDSVTNSGTDTVTTTKSGNIGTVTAAQMIKEELEVRQINLTDKAISAFINACTIY